MLRPDNKVILVDGRQLVSLQVGNVILMTEVDGALRVVVRSCHS